MEGIIKFVKAGASGVQRGGRRSFPPPSPLVGIFVKDLTKTKLFFSPYSPPPRISLPSPLPQGVLCTPLAETKAGGGIKDQIAATIIVIRRVYQTFNICIVYIIII